MITIEERILEVANSALGGAARPCATIDEARHRLGARGCARVAARFLATVNPLDTAARAVITAYVASLPPPKHHSVNYYVNTARRTLRCYR